MTQSHPYSAHRRGSLLLMALMAAMSAAVCYALVLTALGNKAWPELAVSTALVATLLAYLALEIRREVRRHRAIAFLSPPVLASVLHFVLAYAAPILIVPFDDTVIRKTSYWLASSDALTWINTVLVLSILCAVAMWAGYRSSIALALAGSLRRWLAGTGWVRREIRPNITVVVVCALVGVVALWIQIRLGVYGYAADYQALFEQARYRQILRYGSDLLTLALFLSAYAAFDRRANGQRNGGLAALMAALLLLNVFEGFLSGFKSLVLMPAVIVGVAYFLVHRKLPLRWILLAISLLFAAYAVVEPFRVLRYSDPNFDSTSTVSIVDNLIKAAQVEQTTDTGFVSQAFLRSELVSMSSVAVHYAENVDAMPGDAPDFLMAIVISPILALVPRAIWPSKPSYQFGLWFYVEVLKGNPLSNTAAGMGPISYFYFIGGWVAAIIGFFAIGIGMRLVYSGFTPLGAGGWIIYLSVIVPIVIIKSEVGPALAGTLQTIPLALVAQAVALRKPWATVSGRQASVPPER